MIRAATERALTLEAENTTLLAENTTLEAESTALKDELKIANARIQELESLEGQADANPGESDLKKKY